MFVVVYLWLYGCLSLVMYADAFALQALFLVLQPNDILLGVV